MPVLARVECRSEGSAEERPVALRLGGERHVVRRIFTDALVGSVEAGQAATRELQVEVSDGRRYRLRRELPEGSWRVWVAMAP